MWVSSSLVWRINDDASLGLDLRQWQVVDSGHWGIFGWSCFGLDTNGCFIIIVIILFYFIFLRMVVAEGGY
jgi:hypothetical protein